MKDARELARRDYVRTHWGDPGDMRDQTLRCADPGEVYFAVMGELYAVTYNTAKGNGPVELWEHKFSRTKPLLCYSPTSKLLLIAGGIYTVTPRGIEK